MSEVEISPLAKRLAEENNVDWRKLRGSGAEGKVVERDVLEFLARVMSGQEDIDPTPEPLPEGMEEWPEEDIAAYRRGSRERASASESASEGSSAPADEIDEGIFLFDDEDDAEPDREIGDEEPAVFASAGGDEIDEDEDLFLDLADEEEEGEEPSGSGRPWDVQVDLDEPSQPRPMRDAVDLGDMGLGSDEPAPSRGDAGEHDLDFVGGQVVEEIDEAVPQGAVSAGTDQDARSHEAPAGEAAAPGTPIVRRGTYFRRHVDLTALKNAQAVLARDFGSDEPLGIAPFLLRAAAKALREHPIGDGRVVLATIEGGLGYFSLGGTENASFRDLVAAVASAERTSDVPSGVSLAVADLSELEIDEAMLDAPVPVLAFGRVLYDDQAGDVRGTLSLSGDIQPDVGARVLAATADLLSTPVRLLV